MCVTILHIKYINGACVLDTIMWLMMVVTILLCILHHKVKWFAIQVGKKIFFYNLKKRSGSNMRDNSINWYAPSKIKVSRLSQEEIDAYKERKAKRQKEKLKEELAKQKIMKLDLYDYENKRAKKTMKRIKRW